MSMILYLVKLVENIIPVFGYGTLKTNWLTKEKLINRKYPRQEKSSHNPILFVEKASENFMEVLSSSFGTKQKSNVLHSSNLKCESNKGSSLSLLTHNSKIRQLGFQEFPTFRRYNSFSRSSPKLKTKKSSFKCRASLSQNFNGETPNGPNFQQQIGKWINFSQDEMRRDVGLDYDDFRIIFNLFIAKIKGFIAATAVFLRLRAASQYPTKEEKEFEAIWGKFKEWNNVEQWKVKTSRKWKKTLREFLLFPFLSLHFPSKKCFF